MRIQNSGVGPSQSQYLISYPTAEARKTAVVKAWSDLAAKYPGTDEGRMAEYFLGTNAADSGDLAGAEKHFKSAIDSSDAAYASMGKLALAQVYAAEGRVKDGADLIQSVIDHPTVLISKETATLALADLVRTTDLHARRNSSNPSEPARAAP